MKLRQKLALVLAATMVVTAVPVVTMAASTNRITKSLTVAKDAKIGYDVDVAGTLLTKNEVPQLIIKLVDEITTKQTFFVKIKDGEFADLAKVTNLTPASIGSNPGSAASVAVKRISGTELQVDVTATATSKVVKDAEIIIPVYATAKTGETSIEVIPEESSVSVGSFIIARTNEAKSTVAIGDVTTFYTAGNVAKITLEEAYVGAFAAGAVKDANGVEWVDVKLTIDHDDFEFNTVGQTATVTLGRGIAATNGTFTVDAKDAQVAVARFPKSAVTGANARGSITIDKVAVKSTTKTPDTGDLNVSVEGELVTGKSYKVSTVADYGVNLKMKDDKAVAIKEGRTEKVTFTLAENVNDSMVAANSRPVTFTLENGFFGHKKVTGTGTSAVTTWPIEIGKVKLGDDTLTSSQYTIDPVKKDDDIIGFEFTLNKTLSPTDIDKITFEDVVVHAGLGKTGDIKLIADGRMIGQKVETTAVNIKDAVELKADAMTVKVGLRDQKGGKIVISEVEKGHFEKGKTLTFDVEDGCGSFTDKPVVKVTSGDLLLGDITMNKTTGKLEVEVKRASKEASTITISDFIVDVDRTVPQGGFDLTVAGDAMTACGDLSVKNFFVVGTPNTEDVTNGTKKVKSIFTIGSTEFTVNDVVTTMDAAPYISADSKTMVPVRYVAEAFGVAKQDIIFGDGTVTLLAGTRTVQLKNNSNVAILNGAPVKMATKVVIKDGRTFAPVAEVGMLLGVPAKWDAAAKVVTFDNTK